MSTALVRHADCPVVVVGPLARRPVRPGDGAGVRTVEPGRGRQGVAGDP
ncbi:hypothetical protein H6H00_25240 [Pseudonocardia petroleophila]|uniref:Uncharacterized protein n=1 Tax=Pseudonocardia petroleophila TaxID=37331 RepID=A0A7G7MF48_9PSEU|nr:hypothetical protein H6H00_25240 [Pseudonocardia petroleophila]